MLKSLKVLSILFISIISLKNIFSQRIANINLTLVHAATRGDLAQVEDLLDEGANVNAIGQSGRTALSFAAGRCRDDVVAKLINRGANVNAKDNHGRTPLMWASMQNHCSNAVNILLANGANAFEKDNGGRTAIDYASSNGWDDIVERLRQEYFKP